MGLPRERLAKWPFNAPTRHVLEYWRNPEATKDKFVKDWALTGDLAKKDEDGYLWFVGRKDDLITSAGYRIGPAEIEDCLIKHKSVAMAAVIGSPDPVRGEIVKAFIVLKPDVSPSKALHEEIQNFVKTGWRRMNIPGDRLCQRTSHDNHRQDYAPGT